MFNKIFETIAEKQLHENAINRFSRKLNYRHYEKIGAIVKFPNGTRGLDMVKVGASNLKRSAIMLGVEYPAAAIIGTVLGSKRS